MLTLTNTIPLTEQNMASPNLCSKLTKEDLVELGDWCWAGYDRDKRSRAKWERRCEAAMDLAMQISKEKSFPWPMCANVQLPLITIAALHFHARAYPAIVDGPDLVQYRVLGDDPDGEQRARSERVSRHMSWQLSEEIKGWEEGQDKLLIHIPVVGCAFKKTYYSGSKRRNESDFVMARDLVLNYWAKSVESCPRKTHVIPLQRNDIYDRVKSGRFRDILQEEWYQDFAQLPVDPNKQEQDNRAGKSEPDPDETTPFVFGEQHVLADLDGDGYEEPYIITFELENKCVVRIVTSCETEADVDRTEAGEIVRVRHAEQFTKYPFIPSPDGGIYDVGFGVLLGPMTESANTSVNQLLDAGTMATTAGGFLTRGAKIRGGNVMVSPFGWTRVDMTGDDLRKSMVPHQVREPSDVLFKLLMMLIEYINRVAGAVDIQVGESPGQNTPAETSRTVNENGQRIYAAIFKRIWRAAKEEYSKLYVLNGMHMDLRQPFGPEAEAALRSDYLGDPSQIAPVADPNVLSDHQRLQQAMTLKQLAATTPGYDWEAVERRVLAAMKIKGVKEVYPGPKDPRATPVPNPKASLEQMKQQGKQQIVQLQMQNQQQQWIAEMMEERRMNNAKIIEIQAKAMLDVADAKGIEQGHAIALIDAQIGMMKSRNGVLEKHIDMAIKMMEGHQKEMEIAATNTEDGGKAGMGNMAGPPMLEGSPGMGSQATGALPG